MTIEEAAADIAINNLQNLAPNTEFYLRDIMEKENWNSLDFHGQGKVGKLFFSKLKSQNLLNSSVIYLGKLDGVERYKKI